MITSEYKFDLEQFLAANRKAYYYFLRQGKFKIMTICLIGLFCFGVYRAFAINESFTASFAFIVLAYYYVIKWPFKRLSLIRKFNKSPYKDTIVKISFDNDGMTVETVNSKSESNWSVITKIIETDQGFLFQLDEILSWAPKESFSSADEFTKLAKSNVPVYVTI